MTPGDIKPTPLGVIAMDQVHGEFLYLYDLVSHAGQQEFAELFQQLLKHTRRHFAAEEAMMTASGYPAAQEHRADHQRVLGEMERFGRRIAAGQTRFARAWLQQQLPDWFRTHLLHMDSSLAAHLKAGSAQPK